MNRTGISNSSDPLAYLAAKAHGLDEECQSILEASGLTEEEISLPEVGSPLRPLRPVVPTFKSNWPVKTTGASSFFEKALMGQMEGLEEEAGTATIGHAEDDLLGDEEPAIDRNGLEEEDDEDAGGWDMGDDVEAENESDFVNVESAEGGAGSSEADLWARNSPIAADHVAAGSFDTAMQLLNRQVGAVNFKPLEARFEEIYQASRTFLPANPGLAPLINYVRRTADETDSRKVLPLIPRDLESIVAGELTAGKTAMRQNKLAEGLEAFKCILRLFLVNAVSSQQQVLEAKQVISTAAQYALAMSLELERRRLTDNQNDITSLAEDVKKRAFELSAYFTAPDLEPAHKTLALVAAMNFANKNKQLSSALGFANALIDRGTSAKFKETVSYCLTPIQRFCNGD